MKFLGKHPGIRRFLFLVIGIYATLMVVMAVFQRSLLYFPSHKTDGGLLKAWVVNGESYGCKQTTESPKAVWLICHGNTGQASSHGYILRCIPLADSAYILEYPGYGNRVGSPRMETLNEAAETAYSLLRKQYPGIPVNVLGESLGSGPASHLATLPEPPDRIVLVVPFDSLASAAQSHYWYLPAYFLVRDRWNNIDALRRYRGPIDIYAAADDNTIPPAHAKNLASWLPQAQFRILSGGHNDWSERIGRIPAPVDPNTVSFQR